MSSELEAAAADSVGGFFRRTRHSLPLGSPCPNCATPLEGPWCHSCGQRAEDYHRSIAKLGIEAVEGLFELDGRLFRTIPRLLFRPGSLTGDYLAGHRVPQIPPFRLFLIVVVIVFFAGSLAPEKTPAQKQAAVAGAINDDVKKDLAKDGINIEMPGVSINTDEPAKPGEKVAFSKNDEANKRVQKKMEADPLGNWFMQRIQAVQENKEAFKNSLSDWGHRLAILALPMSAAILGLMFFWRKKFYIFDHLIFSMHSLSFQGLLMSVILGMSAVTHNEVWWVLILASPVHLYKHMRGVYGRGRITTLLRMFVLFVASCVGATLIMGMVFLMGLMDMGSRTSTKAIQNPAAAGAPDAKSDRKQAKAALKSAIKGEPAPAPKPKPPKVLGVDLPTPKPPSKPQ